MALANKPSPYSFPESLFSPEFSTFPQREIFESNSPSINNFIFRTANHHQDQDQDQINFNSNGFEKFVQNSESLITFEQNNPFPLYMKVTSDKNDDFPMWDNFTSFESASNFSSSDSTLINDRKRQSENKDLGDGIQAMKKQCTNSNRKEKPKPVVQSKEPQPQSAAAKNRREKISERLKVLQELVPNGSKVDMVTMLEKAISYVKFLQLQVKVLATDEFWPMQDGKAPNIAQVKEAIDALLS